MTITIGPVGLNLIKHFEGFEAHRYQNAGDVPTIGYGTTAGAGVVNPLPEVCTETEASEWLLEYVERAVLPQLEAAMTAGHRAFNRNQVDALASFGYNLGAGVFGPGYYMGKLIRIGAPNDEISAAFLDYEAGDGQAKLAGLVTRREVERALFDRPIGAPNPGGY